MKELRASEVKQLVLAFKPDLALLLFLAAP